MRRWALIIYLMLLGPAEPVLCPCSLQLFVSSGPTLGSLGTLRGVPECSCCAIGSMFTIFAQERGPLPTDSQCPCQCQAGNEVLPLVRKQEGSPSTDKARGSLLSAPQLLLSSTVSLNASLRSNVRNGGTILSPRNRLRVLCLMRC